MTTSTRLLPDKVAEYALAALIWWRRAAKKLGLLALAGVFHAKFLKVIVVGGLALAGGLFKWRRKKAAAVPACGECGAHGCIAATARNITQAVTATDHMGKLLVALFAAGKLSQVGAHGRHDAAVGDRVRIHIRLVG